MDGMFGPDVLGVSPVTHTISAVQRQRPVLDENEYGSSCLTPSPISVLITLSGLKCPRQDSNLRTRLRRPLLYPLSYGGVSVAERCARGDGQNISRSGGVIRNPFAGRGPL